MELREVRGETRAQGMWRDLRELRREDSGTEPVRRTVRMPRVMSVKPREREK